MQTKQQIQMLLASAGVSPNKKLGQNFLIDQNLLRFLLEHADISKDDIVLEVGCGTGTLTEAIAETAGALVVIEYDKVMAMVTSGQIAEFDNVTIINGDALKNKNAMNVEAVKLITELKPKFSGDVKLVANLPYNVAASIMANLITGEMVVDSMYVTIQKEVAQRMNAKPGDSLYGILSILMEATGEVKFLRKLPQSVFWPPPKVESAMVEFIRDEEKIGRIKDISLFRKVISLFMGHRRKMMKACTKFADDELSQIKDWPSIFEKAQIDPTLRSEKLVSDDYIRLANLIYDQIN